MSTLISRIKAKLKTKGHTLVKEGGFYNVIDQKIGSIILSKVTLDYLAEQVGE